MRKLILTTLALAVFAVPAAAQTINATATIGNAAAYGPNQDLTWNAITPTGSSGNSAATVTLTTGGTPGYVRVWTNTSSTEVTVDLSSAALVNGGASITPSYTCAASTTTAAPGALAACADGQTFTHARVGSTNETFSVWFGGTIAGTDIDTAAAGTYTGTISVTVTNQTT